jgi:hypothetical protein
MRVTNNWRPWKLIVEVDCIADSGTQASTCDGRRVAVIMTVLRHFYSCNKIQTNIISYQRGAAGYIGIDRKVNDGLLGMR